MSETAARGNTAAERLFVAVLPQKGAPFYVCPSFEEERARDPGFGMVEAFGVDEAPEILVGGDRPADSAEATTGAGAATPEHELAR